MVGGGQIKGHTLVEYNYSYFIERTGIRDTCSLWPSSLGWKQGFIDSELMLFRGQQRSDTMEQCGRKEEERVMRRGQRSQGAGTDWHGADWKAFGFYPEYGEKPLVGFWQRKNSIWHFNRMAPVHCWYWTIAGGGVGRGNQSRETS